MGADLSYYTQKDNQDVISFENRIAILIDGIYYCPRCKDAPTPIYNLSNRNPVEICPNCFSLVRIEIQERKCLKCGIKFKTNKGAHYCNGCRAHNKHESEIGL